MFFDYNQIWQSIKNGFAWLWEKIFGDLNGITQDSSTDNSSSVNLLGWKNQIGDRIVGSGFIDRREQLQLISSGVDPRDIEKYLSLLDEYKTREEKETRILDWYYTQEIDIALKETLLIIVSKLSEVISHEVVFRGEGAGNEILSIGHQSLHKAIEGLKTLLKDYQFDKINNYITTELTRFTDSHIKMSFLIEIGNIYSTFKDLEKALLFYRDAFQLVKTPDSVLPYANLAIQLNRTNEAYKALDEAIDLMNDDPFPLNAYLYERYGFVLSKLNRLKEAEEALSLAKKAILDSGSENTKKYLDLLLKIYRASISLQIINGDLNSARKVLVEAVESIEFQSSTRLDFLYQEEKFTSLFNNISLYYSSLNQWNISFNFAFSQVQFLLESEPEDRAYSLFDVVTSGLNLAVTYLYNNEYGHARKTLLDIRSILDDYLKNQQNSYYIMLFTLLWCVGYLLEDDRGSYIYLSKAFDILNQLDNVNPLLTASIYSHIGNVYQMKRNFAKSKIYFRKVQGILLEQLGGESQKVQEINTHLDNLEITKKRFIVFY